MHFRKNPGALEGSFLDFILQKIDFILQKRSPEIKICLHHKFRHCGFDKTSIHEHPAIQSSVTIKYFGFL